MVTLKQVRKNPGDQDEKRTEGMRRAVANYPAIAAKVVSGRYGVGVPTRNMIKALKMHPWLNTVEDWQRLFEAEYAVKCSRGRKMGQVGIGEKALRYRKNPSAGESPVTAHVKGKYTLSFYADGKIKLDDGWRSDWPLLYPHNGQVVYDNPEWWPASVREWAGRLIAARARRKNPAPSRAARSEKLHKMRQKLVRELKVEQFRPAPTRAQEKREADIRRKLQKLDRLLYAPGKHEARSMGLRSNPAKSKLDKHSARELLLYITNDGQLYRGQAQAIIENLRRKRKKGSYNGRMAVKGWQYLADAGARKYVGEFGSRGDKVDSMFTAQTRRVVAKLLSSHYREEVFD